MVGDSHGGYGLDTGAPASDVVSRQSAPGKVLLPYRYYSRVGMKACSPCYITGSPLCSRGLWVVLDSGLSRCPHRVLGTGTPGR